MITVEGIAVHLGGWLTITVEAIAVEMIAVEVIAVEAIAVHPGGVNQRSLLR